MKIRIRDVSAGDLQALTALWNQVVEEGNAFPQEEPLTEETGKSFFLDQNVTRAAEDGDRGRLVGLYILHPNNVGRCGHICNASYAVDRALRGRHIGEKLVLDSLRTGAALGYTVMQFNAVVASNLPARHLYERLGFRPLGVIPGGFRRKDGRYEDICPYYLPLTRIPGTE